MLVLFYCLTDNVLYLHLKLHFPLKLLPTIILYEGNYNYMVQQPEIVIFIMC